MRKILPLVLLALAGPVLAQPAPFDMSPERRPTATPRTVPLGLAPRPLPAAPQTAPEAQVRSYLLPGNGARLSGEMAEGAWTVMLAADAPRAAQLHIGYQNSVMVAPEASSLRITINGKVIAEEPVESPTGVTALSFPVPDGILHRGANVVKVEASQRHRTDCTAESTYQLWTELRPAETYLSYEVADGARFAEPGDVIGIGRDAQGITRVAVVAPGLDQAPAARALLVLAQKLALVTGAPHIVFDVARVPTDSKPPAALTVVMGTRDELARLPLALPGETARGPVMRFVETAAGQGPLLLVAGPTSEALGEVLASWDGGRSGSGDAPGFWPGTTAPLLGSGGSIAFSALGIPTEQFSGRRYMREFSVAVPSDIYTQAYGEAKIMLDAALSGEVQPGSRIDIYVNDQIAATYPIMDTGGGVLRQLPIRVGLREMRPGPNRIRLEAIMLTDADDACAPGTTASDDPRFGLFETTRLVMPQFARIAKRPDLAAFAAAGAPYVGQAEPVALVMDARNEASLAAAMDIAGRMAVTVGHVLPFDLASVESDLDARSAIFLSPAARIRPAVLERVGFATGETAGWEAGKAPAQGTSAADAQALEEWRDSLENSPIRRRVRDLSDSLQENFDLSLTALRPAPARMEAFSPAGDATLVLAQAANPAGSGTWTVITAPNDAALQTGAAAIAERDTWGSIDGRLSAFAAATGRMTTLSATAPELVPTQPWSVGNARLIATNWMSENALAYSLLLMLACILLGAVTLALLKQLGRRS